MYYAIVDNYIVARCNTVKYAKEKIDEYCIGLETFAEIVKEGGQLYAWRNLDRGQDWTRVGGRVDNNKLALMAAYNN